MLQRSAIFDQNYDSYVEQLAKINFKSIKTILGIACHGDQAQIHFLNHKYLISKNGIKNSSGNRPDYRICVILAKYILLCPSQIHLDTKWVSFKDFKRTSHFTNTNFFASDTQSVMVKHFSGRLKALFNISKKLGGVPHKMETPYDLSVQFNVLPRMSLLLLFNDSDEDFPAHCNVLFPKHAEFYLDPESLAVTSAVLANSLIETDQTWSD
ncbi:protein of unknown function [Desulfocicer vacuolatum DSM 3385]|uniref:DUF3786 domain-containing protein n=1 Tax=Desulfocicer vacuolatum DSM 3385 TaxID=1121400 RepID=A0A1W1YTY8_9BACT|nr:DUF3786 domain-containing protein [Desulfocicer vacuolatum]SMC39596.1 protein of unknown function [Desulfocicer vacuolatum DSM 3385]